MSRETILEERAGGVLTVTLNRPQKKNAFNNRQYDEFRDMLAEAQENKGVRVVVVTGAGGAFTAGQDLTEMSPKEPPGGKPTGFFPFLERLAAFDKPLFAAADGVAIGIGTTMLLHCDVVHVGEGARLRIPFVSLGIMAEAGSSLLLQQIVGPQKAAELLYTGRWIGAQEAVDVGLAARLYPSEELLPATLELAREIAAQPPKTLRENKQLLLAARKDALSAAIEREMAAGKRLIGGAENMEAIMAFLQKRKPDFMKFG